MFGDAAKEIHMYDIVILYYIKITSLWDGSKNPRKNYLVSVQNMFL